MHISPLCAELPWKNNTASNAILKNFLYRIYCPKVISKLPKHDLSKVWSVTTAHFETLEFTSMNHVINFHLKKFKNVTKRLQWLLQLLLHPDKSVPPFIYFKNFVGLPFPPKRVFSPPAFNNWWKIYFDTDLVYCNRFPDNLNICTPSLLLIFSVLINTGHILLTSADYNNQMISFTQTNILHLIWF